MTSLKEARRISSLKRPQTGIVSNMSVTHARQEFHVSKASRDAHGFEEALFGSRGRVIFANFAAARRFATALNLKSPARGARAGDLNAMGLIDEVLHALMSEYRAQHKPTLWTEALQLLEANLGQEAVEKALETFAADFPPLAVFKNQVSLREYMTGSSDGVPHREVLLEELLLLWLENHNPAFAPYKDLFDDSNLRQNTVYQRLISSLEGFLEQQAPFAAAGGLTLWRVLRLPVLSHPDSLEGQLRLLLERFGGAFGADRFNERLGAAGASTVRSRLLGGLDLILEENRYLETLSEARVGGGAGRGTQFGGGSVQRVSSAMLEYEPEAFTQDQSWMPRLVLLAKNAFVWLDQLRKTYGSQIQTLRDVPDAELERLQSWGVTGLWLIGLWERSAASKEIKHRMGNPDAVASAYSLYDYAIATALGGTSALEDLKVRAWRYGIRMASDMVPNHVGIDGKWVVEHPEWFLQTSESPFPGYTFNSQNLSQDSRVGIYLEDHYYAKTDAAVVFKRFEFGTGNTQYIYHGNDGSGLPWNDTAQLNYLLPAVREMVIETILDVARQFPVIRFDAAMTLAKRHIKRLWFPEPGSGEGIASRSEYGLTKEQFDALMPLEFWREVVDRAAVEAPDTLLLAEAFWMMEGYFVRTLGMHRVYNSAFMHMLRDEQNEEYRAILKETAATEPEILKRYVNFLNNPDEKSAVEQFGKGDKYFGVMTLCATLPGLPMIGHGQIEGYAEKYGMEYQRAYYDERPDEGLIHHHGSQIFPLLKRRALFAETEHFVIYDVNAGSSTLEHVYAYSNSRGSERALVLYNNSPHAVSGTLKAGQGAKRESRLFEALSLTSDTGDRYAIYRDLVSSLEFIKSTRDLSDGFAVQLGAYGRMVLLDWREVWDADGRYGRVARMLEGRGVESVEAIGLELYLERVLTPWNALVNITAARRLMQPDAKLFGELEARTKALADGVEAHTGRDLAGGSFAAAVRGKLEGLKVTDAVQPLEALAVIVTTELARATGGDARGLLDEWLLARQLERSFKEAGLGAWEAGLAVARVKFLTSQSPTLDTPSVSLWAADLDAPMALGLNHFEGATYVNSERLEATVSTAKLLVKSAKKLEALQKTISSAGYRLEVQAAVKSAPVKKPVKAAEVPEPASSKPAKSSSAKIKIERTAKKPVKAAATLEPALAKPAKPSSAKVAVKPTVKPTAKTPKSVSAPVIPEDLTVINGIGPKVAAALSAGGIVNFALLAASSESDLRVLLETAGIKLLRNVETWAAQAKALEAQK